MCFVKIRLSRYWGGKASHCIAYTNLSVVKTFWVIIQWLLDVNRNQIHLLSDSFDIKKSPSNNSLSLYPVTRPLHLSQLTDRSTGQWGFSVLYVLMNQPDNVNLSAPWPNKMVSGYNCEPERCSRLADCRSGFKGWRKAEELSWGHKGRENVSQWSCLISQCCSLILAERWFKGWEEGAAVDSSLICSRYVLMTAQVSLWVIIASWENKQDAFVLWCIMTSFCPCPPNMACLSILQLQEDKTVMYGVHSESTSDTEISIQSWLRYLKPDGKISLVDRKISELDLHLFEYPVDWTFICLFILNVMT